MAEPVTLWQQGDRWKDLAEILRAPATVVTASGTTRLIDVAAGWTTRLPYSAIDRLPGDGERVPITSVPVATSCGLRIAGPAPCWTTEVALVLADLVPAWQATGVEWPPRGRWSALGHPERPCGAAHCVVAMLRHVGRRPR
jgi:hypothetical protein